MIRYYLRLLVFALPFIALTAMYVIRDPFMIIYTYDHFNEDHYIDKNLDYTTSELFINKHDEYGYDSYIFGGSTALYVTPETWKNYIQYNEVLSFVSSSEHVAGIWSKLKYIDEHGKEIKNALVVFDNHVTFGEFRNESVISMKHYKIYESSAFDFHYKYFSVFIDLKFLLPLLHYETTNNFQPYMDNILLRHYYYYDTITNEFYNVGILEELKNDSTGYYSKRLNKFGNQKRAGMESSAQIDASHLEMLNEMKEIFEKYNTEYRILISPAYNQEQMNRKDVEILRTVFGAENVYDFSGINEFSEEMSNFYDELHFKKYVGDQMIDIMYSD